MTGVCRSAARSCPHPLPGAQGMTPLALFVCTKKVKNYHSGRAGCPFAPSLAQATVQNAVSLCTRAWRKRKPDNRQQEHLCKSVCALHSRRKLCTLCLFLSARAGISPGQRSLIAFFYSDVHARGGQALNRMTEKRVKFRGTARPAAAVSHFIPAHPSCAIPPLVQALAAPAAVVTARAVFVLGVPVEIE